MLNHPRKAYTRSGELEKGARIWKGNLSSLRIQVCKRASAARRIIIPMLFAHAATWLFEGHSRKMKRSFIHLLLPVSSSNERLATESVAFL
jgi:hypothetical protein